MEARLIVPLETIGMVKGAKRNRRPRFCACCGKPESAEGERLKGDHVLPKALFNVLDLQMVTASACKSCQVVKAYGEDDLRDFANTHWASERHPEAAEQPRKMLSATRQRRSTLGNAIIRGGTGSRLTTPAGLDLGPVWEVPIPGDNRDMMRTLELIARGLYAHEQRSPLPAVWSVQAMAVDTLVDAPRIVRFFADMPGRVEPRIKGHAVAWWTHVLSPATR